MPQQFLTESDEQDAENERPEQAAHEDDRAAVRFGGRRPIEQAQDKVARALEEEFKDWLEQSSKKKCDEIVHCLSAIVVNDLGNGDSTCSGQENGQLSDVFPGNGFS